MKKDKNESLLKNRIKSIGYAFNGAVFLLKTESSIQIQTIIAMLVTFMGFYFEISKTEWLFQIISIGLVISTEALNTAIEGVADFIHPEHHKKIGIIKDVAAGAVFIASFFALLTGVIIYYPKLF